MLSGVRGSQLLGLTRCKHPWKLLRQFRLQAESYATASAAPDKKQNPAKQKEGGDSDSGAKESAMQLMLKMLEPQKIDKTKLSKEELTEYEEKAKDYSRRKMAAHREWQKDLNGKIALMKAAIAALPSDLREAALIVDETPFPADRNIFTHTPPNPEYQRTEQQETVVDDDQFARRF